jgi:RNA polymerase sigma-70 factor (ECF subfamily)
MQLDTEQRAWSSFYRRFASPVFTYISRPVRNRQDAEDLLLEVFLSASQEIILQEWSEERQIAWLRKVTRNKIIDYQRHKGLISWLPLIQAYELEDAHLTPEASLDKQEEYTQLYQALQRLSTAQQELILLRYGHELRFSEIAEILERPEGAIRKMLTRTLRQLRKYYEQRER